MPPHTQPPPPPTGVSGDQPAEAQTIEPTRQAASTEPIRDHSGTPATEVTPQAVPLSPQAPTRLHALVAFLRAPFLREAKHLPMNDIANLLHLLHETPERHIVLSKLSPARTVPEAEAI